MRNILIAALAAAGIAVVGCLGASAAPANGIVIRDGTNLTEPMTLQVGWHGRGRSHWRWGSRGGHWRWGSRRWWR